MLDQKIAKFNVPELSDTQVEQMLKTIRPLVRLKGRLFYVEQVDPKEVSFLWDPSFTREADGLATLAVIPTLHSFGYHGLFKPSIEEVLRHIPCHLLDQVAAFEVEGPGDAEALNRQKVVVDMGYHLASTTLYTSS